MPNQSNLLTVRNADSAALIRSVKKKEGIFFPCIMECLPTSIRDSFFVKWSTQRAQSVALARKPYQDSSTSSFKKREYAYAESFFSAHLILGRKLLNWTLSTKVLGAFSFTDKRGKHCSANPIPDEITNSVKEHIKSFPTMESHYCRKYSKKQYLSQDLNIRKMWMLYQHGRRSIDLPAVKESKYWEIFCNDINLQTHTWSMLLVLVIFDTERAKWNIGKKVSGAPDEKEKCKRWKDKR